VRLDPRLRWTLYIVFGALFLSGALWLIADQLKESDEIWQETAVYLLMLHGGTAMLALLLLGALAPLHIGRGWRSDRNRVTGSAMVTVNAVLIITAFGLYYLGSDAVRPWTSRVHYGIGLALPILLLVHVLRGRWTAARQAADARAPVVPEAAE
jgi:cyanate permease